MAAPLAAGTRPPELSPEAAINHFLHTLRRPTRLLIAISGGSDSTGLLVTLVKVLRESRLPHTLAAATIDHGLRPASAGEAREVSTLCQRLGIPHRILQWTGEKPETGLSAAARLARYRLLSDAAASMGADAIVTGHTLDDQIETVAMRADRSAGDALGLAGMAPATLYAGHIWILRPFLHTRRNAIRDHLRAQRIDWIDDPSNDDPRYERVRIRQSSPANDPGMIERAGQRRAMLSTAAAVWLAEYMETRPGPVAIVSLSDGGPIPNDVRDHALATLVAILGGKPHRPAAASLTRLSAALDQGFDFRLTLSGTLTLRRRSQLFLLRERRGLLPLSLAPYRTGIWDGRYAIVNKSAVEITVMPGPAREIGADLPGIAREALAGITPQVTAQYGFSVPERDLVTITPRLSLYADFLPLFDVPLADTIARLLGAEPAPPPLV
ncbi:tRNA lysidine(34) synthetase TilS [Rhizobium sp. WL3]|uniref:tRNA lysidine(34) synthetase TilS n=1 Tax=Rhizobium sp. WL3 TaxID=2603277 RepID=UPI0011C1E42F|nr:tRNA lysidine(34) synthetase TilS [Rhizobium sp. WL3]QEE44782.1 tRNA lysidine(34) synthetase TilS [Rhizobium sp. WL3]